MYVQQRGRRGQFAWHVSRVHVNREPHWCPTCAAEEVQVTEEELMMMTACGERLNEPVARSDKPRRGGLCQMCTYLDQLDARLAP